MFYFSYFLLLIENDKQTSIFFGFRNEILIIAKDFRLQLIFSKSRFYFNYQLNFAFQQQKNQIKFLIYNDVRHSRT